LSTGLPKRTVFIAVTNKRASYGAIREAPPMAWLALLLAGALEIGWSLGLKYSEGFTRLWPSLATLLAIGLSFGLLAIALESVPFGTAYAIWTGIGMAGTAVVGIVLFGESADPLRITCLILVLVGIIGLRFAESN
jgi:quaternary ammonium compound-resistance protein SugE